MVARRSINRLVAPDAGPTLDTVARRTTCSRRQYERAQFAALSEAIGRERIDHGIGGAFAGIPAVWQSTVRRTTCRHPPSDRTVTTPRPALARD